MSASKLARRAQQFEDALQRLHQVLSLNVADDLVLDAAIQRFEFTFELAWKCLKAGAETVGLTAPSPREAIKQGFAQGWISDEALWLALMKARNESSHIYDEQAALRIFALVQQNVRAFDEALTSMQRLAATP